MAAEVKMETMKWTSKRVDEMLVLLEDGFEIPKNNPFWDGNPDFRLGNIVFEYTPEEYEELRKCKADVIYFANKYCYAMTDDGVQNINLRDYQEDVLSDLQENRFCVFLAPRQIGKTITTSIFLAWYILFNTDKNCLILANKGETTAELLDKSKTILKHLPFFMKPGMLVNNVMSMRFDNGCRLFGQSTTKTPAIGFTIHFLYMDEFAHIHANFLEPFYRAVYPTISSSKVSRIVISSTPNGMNKFYEIYTGAMEGNNDYHPIRVDWWQVPGRDEDWKRKEIGNLGSEESFNQEYGNQFLPASSLLLSTKTLKDMKTRVEEFKWVELEPFDDKGIKYDDLKWHPKFNPETAFDEKAKTQYLFTIDTAGGTGKDFSVINILKIIPSPVDLIGKTISYQDETDFFSLLQVGIFRSNKTGIEELNYLLEVLMYDIFDPEQVRILLELDYKGYLLYEKMKNNHKFYDELMVHTRHTEKAKMLSPGLRQSDNTKMLNCLEFRKHTSTGRIIITEKKSYEELRAFGLNNRGKYESQSGHDDIAMTFINIPSYFRSNEFLATIEEIYDGIEEKYKKAIEKKLADLGEKDNGPDINFLRGIME
jgi:hypothetical protein